MGDALVEALVKALALTVLFVGAAWIGVVIRKFIHARDVRALPSARERALLLARLDELRRGGAGLDACMADLRRRGLRKGVAEGLVIDYERQQQADVAHVQAATWRGHAFRYPGNWRLAPLVDTAGPEAGISIDGIGSALWMLVPNEDGEAGYVDLVRQQENEITSPQRSPVHAWGPFEGEGVRISGPHRKLRLLVDLLVFRPRDVSPRFCLVQFHAVEEEQRVGSGFQLIQDTWQRP